MSPRLELRGVSAGYGRIEVLHDVDLVLPAGATVAVVGGNGAGKSTLLRLLAGLVRVRSGVMLDGGVPVRQGTAHRRAATGITLVPDEHNVFGSLTVAENLRLFAAGGPTAPALAAFPELEALLGRRCSTLSGGERQMVALGHALVRPGRALLVDEPSRGLAPAAVARAYDALRGSGRRRPAGRDRGAVHRRGAGRGRHRLRARAGPGGLRRGAVGARAAGGRAGGLTPVSSRRG